ncbi:hypothetical protein PR048_011117 [Dryococelus australis]|uniref:Uncharacterized protein n=1 Tax=Dryococelus australis TaxID=614101 RepID=A0ABQ9HKQ6_9NEOP|nr:hypothetical protein PR048_011117 [Dryococelus australis]
MGKFTVGQIFPDPSMKIPLLITNPRYFPLATRPGFARTLANPWESWESSGCLPAGRLLDRKVDDIVNIGDCVTRLIGFDLAGNSLHNEIVDFIVSVVPRRYYCPGTQPALMSYPKPNPNTWMHEQPMMQNSVHKAEEKPVGTQPAQLEMMWFQQLPHFAIVVCWHPNMHFLNWWIGRGGPMAWPLRSPYITPPDFWLWGHIILMVYATPFNMRDELIMPETFAHVPPI